MKRTGLFLCSLLMLVGVAKAETFRIPVGEFSELVVNENISVIYSSNPDSVGMVVFDTKNEYAHFIMTECNKGKLKIQVSADAVGINLPTVYVYSSFLSRIENLKNGTVKASGIKPTAKFSAELQGNGTIEVEDLEATTVDLKILSGKGSILASGKATDVSIKNVGTGSINAEDLKCKTAKCSTTGTGSINCWATQSLSIGGLGSGKVYYKGSPTITKGKLSNIKALPLAEVTVIEEEESSEPAETAVEQEEDNTPTNDRTRIQDY